MPDEYFGEGWGGGGGDYSGGFGMMNQQQPQGFPGMNMYNGGGGGMSKDPNEGSLNLNLFERRPDGGAGGGQQPGFMPGGQQKGFGDFFKQFMDPGMMSQLMKMGMDFSKMFQGQGQQQQPQMRQQPQQSQAPPQPDLRAIRSFLANKQAQGVYSGGAASPESMAALLGGEEAGVSPDNVRQAQTGALV